MAGGGPLRSREFSSVAEMQRHAAEVRSRLFPTRQVEAAPMLPVVKRLASAPAEAPASQAGSDPKVEQQGFIPPKPLRPEDFEDQRAFPMKHLSAIVAAVTGVTVSELQSHRRRPNQVKARQILFWLGKTYTALSMSQVAHRVGRRDHTTAMWGIRKVQAVVDRLNIEKADCPILMTERLWAADWSKVSK